jgi:prolyl-tRNA synthetase
VSNFADALYERLNAAGLDVLYDDSPDRAGAKFNRMDLIGLPWVLTVGPRGVKSVQVELKHRASGEKIDLSPEDAVARILGMD